MLPSPNQKFQHHWIGDPNVQGKSILRFNLGLISQGWKPVTHVN